MVHKRRQESFTKALQKTPKSPNSLCNASAATPKNKKAIRWYQSFLAWSRMTFMTPENPPNPK
eukprot:4461995-Amphidinium_carterae.1